MTSKKITITGLVQGVCFRATTKEKALALGLCGWVQNTDDGDVTMQVEGPDDAIQAFIEWCHEGPPAAQVSEVQVEDCEKEGLEGFEVR